MYDPLNSRAKILASVRVQLAVSIEAEKEQEILLNESEVGIAHQKAVHLRRDLEKESASVKSLLSEAMVDHFEETGEKKFSFGQVLDKRTVSIGDKEAAFAWAVNHNLCLTLDQKAIKKIAEELKPDGVVIKMGHATKIDSDLSALLEKESE